MKCQFLSINKIHYILKLFEMSFADDDTSDCSDSSQSYDFSFGMDEFEEFESDSINEGVEVVLQKDIDDTSNHSHARKKKTCTQNRLSRQTLHIKDHLYNTFMSLGIALRNGS